MSWNRGLSRHCLDGPQAPCPPRGKANTKYRCFFCLSWIRSVPKARAAPGKTTPKPIIYLFFRSSLGCWPFSVFLLLILRRYSVFQFLVGMLVVFSVLVAGSSAVSCLVFFVFSVFSPLSCLLGLAMWRKAGRTEGPVGGRFGHAVGWDDWADLRRIKR